MVASTSGLCSPDGSLAMAGAGGLPADAAGGQQVADPAVEDRAEGQGGAPRGHPWGLLAAAGLGAVLTGLHAVAVPFLAPALRRVCLPFVPATPRQLHSVLRLLPSRPGPLVDVGSGDGRVVIAAAKAGFPAVGYELNPWLVWFSRYRAWRAGVHGFATFHICDLWKVSFSQFSNVVVFGVPQMMPQLEKKLEQELQAGARVIACRFPFPSWTPTQVAGRGTDTAWAYDAGAFRGAAQRP